MTEENRAALQSCFARMLSAGVQRLTVSRPVKEELYRKITAQMLENGWQLTRYTEKQVFHENVTAEQICEACTDATAGHFQQVNGFSADAEHMLRISKKGKCAYHVNRTNAAAHTQPEPQTHNRKKHYLLEEGRSVAPLTDMGVFTQDGKVVRSMYDKFRQINRFLEILDDEIDRLQCKTLNVIDFGCGKSYLTFIVYYYLTQLKGIHAQIIGLDLKADVIEKCNAAARKYGYDGLRFELGDINGYQAPFDVDVVMTLHACDTATDYALFNAIAWKARLIFSVPCCQHELNGQISSEDFSILTRYGILKERFSALATDAIRGNLLEACGYKTQLLEFIDLEHTPKNLLIRAVRRGMTPQPVRDRALREVRALTDEFHLHPTLCKLLDIET